MKTGFIKKSVPACILLTIVFGGSLTVILLRDLLGLLLYEPLLSTQTYCLTHPCVEVGSLVISQPSSSFFVYLLALLTILVGLTFLKTVGRQQSRFWWALFLIMFGVGAGLAGTSYQAFEYIIKCRGFDYCLWTSWWELSYMIFTVGGLGAAFIGVSHAVLPARARKFWTGFALLNTLAYLFVVITGMVTANRFLLSFEVMVVFAFTGFLVIVFQCLGHYRHNKDSLIIKIISFGGFLALVVVIYFIALFAGLGAFLGTKGIWFNANDVLHILMIGWVLYGYRTLGDALKDKQDGNET